MDIFTTREIAMIMWSLIFGGFILVNKNNRKYIVDIIKIIFSTNIIIPFIVILIYLGALLSVFIFELKLGRYINLKEVIL